MKKIPSNSNDVYTAEEEPKVTISIERLYRWHMWESNGTLQQSGMGVRKDTTVYIKDANAVREIYKKKKEKIIYEERKRFNKNN